MNCQKCGKELHQEEQSCSACGWNREETGAENGMAEGGTTAGNSALQQENAAAENEKRRIYPIISGIIMGAMALTIIVMGGYIAMDAWRAAPMESAMEDALLAEMRLFDENGLLAARIGETWGFIDKTGKWVINPQFQQVDAFAGNGLCAVQIPDGEQNGKWGYVNTKGEYAVSPNYEQAGRFAANGLAAVKEYTENGDGKWGYIDAQGVQVVPFQFDTASAFNEKGQAIVALGEKYGMINAKGTYIVNPQFDSLSASMDTSGELLAFETAGKTGYADQTGTYVIQPDFIK